MTMSTIIMAATMSMTTMRETDVPITIRTEEVESKM